MSGKALLAVLRASRPSFSSRADKLAFAVHAAVLVNGYRLMAVGPSSSEDAPPADAPECDVDGWNSQPGEYTFKYAAEDAKGAGLLVKALTMDNLLLVSFLSFGDVGNPQTLELDAEYYTSDAQDPAAALPHLDELATKVDSVLGPPASKQTAATTSAKASTASTSGAASLEEAPGRRAPRTGSPPTYSDDPLREPDPLRVGTGDLDPLALHPKGGPGFPGRLGGVGGVGGIGGIGGYPPRGPAGGGMHVGPDHPFFQDRLRQPGMRPPGMPPPGLPPGARWDPIRPPGMEGFNPDDFQRQPGRRRDLDDIGPPPGRGGADWDHMFG